MPSLPAFGLLWALLAAASSTPRGWAPPDTLTITPETARTGILYGGVTVAVSGEVTCGQSVAALLTGPGTDLELRRQTRVWGIFWAPGSRLKAENVPSLYLLHSSVPPAELAPDTLLRELGIGDHAACSNEASALNDSLRLELVRLRESQGLFQMNVGGLQWEELAPGHWRVSTTFHVPTRAPPATYAIQLLAFCDGQVAEQLAGSFTLEQGTFAGFLDSLATDYGLLYGVFAVVLALAAGLVVGLVFGSPTRR